MFTAFKKLIGSGDDKPNSSNSPAGVQTLSHNLQRKFAKGVNYNMKIIIKGDRNTGKTCLFQRLQGQGFRDEYTPSEEIKVCCIQWSYKATDDVIKVEVWDVVDKGKKKKRTEGLKLDNAKKAALTEQPEELALDAEFIDVYKNTNGVLLMIDITKQWTFDYVRRELPKVPDNIPVLILANHRDMGHHRVVTEDDVKFFVESLDRLPSAAPVRYSESSMRNGFGLKFIHKFFNLPFLQLQRETLIGQLQTNGREMELTTEELDAQLESDDQNYDLFADAITNKRRQIADQLSQVPDPTNGPVVEPNPAALPRSQSTYTDIKSKILEFNPIKPSLSVPATPLEPTNPISHVTQAAPPCKQFSQQQSILISRNIASNAKQTNGVTGSKSDSGRNGAGVSSVEEFVPEEGGLDRDFLEDDRALNGKMDSNDNCDYISDSDKEEGSNPMVQGFRDVDPEDDDFKLVQSPTVGSTNDVVFQDDLPDLDVYFNKSRSTPYTSSDSTQTKISTQVEKPAVAPYAMSDKSLDDWLGSGNDEPNLQTGILRDMNNDFNLDAASNAGGGSDSTENAPSVKPKKERTPKQEKSKKKSKHGESSSKTKEVKSDRKSKKKSKKGDADEADAMANLEEFLGTSNELSRQGNDYESL